MSSRTNNHASIAKMVANCKRRHSGVVSKKERSNQPTGLCVRGFARQAGGSHRCTWVLQRQGVRRTMPSGQACQWTARGANAPVVETRNLARLAANSIRPRTGSGFIHGSMVPISLGAGPPRRWKQYSKANPLGRVHNAPFRGRAASGLLSRASVERGIGIITTGWIRL
jgi:hypothetical protein